MIDIKKIFLKYDWLILDIIFILFIIAEFELYIEKTEDGQLLLNLYKNEGWLNNDLRNKLARIIVSNEQSWESYF